MRTLDRPARRHRLCWSIIVGLFLGTITTAAGAAFAPVRAAASSVPLHGTVATSGTSTRTNLDAFGLPAFSLKGKALKVTLSVSDPFKVGSLDFFVGTKSLSNSIKYRFDAATTSARFAKPGEPTSIYLQASEINATYGGITRSRSGVPSATSGFTDVRFQATDNGTGPITVHVDSVQIVDAVPPARLSITFDDSNGSVYRNALPAMKAHGYPGTAYVIADSIGQPGRLTLKQTKTLTSVGWEIGGHANTLADHGVGLTALTTKRVADDLHGLHGWLAKNFPARVYSFAYPLGRYANTTDGAGIEGLVQRAGFASGRTILSNVSVPTQTMLEYPKPARPYRLNAMSSISSRSHGQYNPTNLTAAGGMIDKLAANGGWMILVFHQVVDNTPTTTAEISKADFNRVLNDIASHPTITVDTVRDELQPPAPPSQCRRR